MAIFTHTSELDTQEQVGNFKSQTGWKKYAMAAMGYKASGEKNTYGKFISGTGLGKNLVAKQFAKGSDAEEVIGSQTGAELQHQMGTAAFAASFIGGGVTGGGGGAGAGAAGGAGASAGNGAAAGGGMFAKAGQGAKGSKAGGFLNKLGGGGGNAATGAGTAGGQSLGQGILKEGSTGSEMLNSEAGKAMTDEITAQGKEKVMEEMNKKGQAGSDDTAVGEDDYAQEQDYKEAQAKGRTDRKGKGIESQESSQSKMAGKAAAYEGIGSHGIVGQGVGLWAERMQIADAYKQKAHSMFQKKQSSAGSGFA